MANGIQVSSWVDTTCSKAHCGDGYTTLGIYLNLFNSVSYIVFVVLGKTQLSNVRILIS